MLYRFANPEMLWLLLLIPLVALLVSRKGRTAAVSFPSVSLARQVAAFVRSNPGRLRGSLRLLALAFLILALARPQTGSDTTEIEASGIDIVLAVDVSPSMLGLDFSTSSEYVTRLEAVKSVIAEFIEDRPNDRIGLVAFAFNPYMVSPITLNHDWLLQNLERLEVGLIEPGTNIGAAIGTSTNRLRDVTAKSKVVILLTDGKDDPPPQISPIAFAEAAASLGVKVYTIAAGKQGRVLSFVMDPRTRKIVTDRRGNKIVDERYYPVNEDILKDIADITRARFYRATDLEALRKIYDQIDQLERREVTLNYSALYHDFFIWPLGAALCLLLLEAILNHTRFRRVP